MPSGNFRLLTIAPYPFLPAATGGHQSIAMMAHYLGLLCQNHVLTVPQAAADHPYSFILHPSLPASSARYLPYLQAGAIQKAASTLGCHAVLCEHPYLFPAAIKAGRQLNIPVFQRSQNIESERFRTLGKPWWRGLRVFEQWTMRQAAGVFFITAEDRKFGIRRYGLQPEKCFTAPFGTPLHQPPASDAGARSRLTAACDLDPDVPWFYFLGALSYPPNAAAVRVLLQEVLPLMTKDLPRFQLLIGGKGLPAEISVLANGYAREVRILGYIADLHDLLLSGAVMLNPVLTGGGIKTKAIEALAHNIPVVSTVSGAVGIDQNACGNALTLVADNDWTGFSKAALAAVIKPSETPDTFYEKYSWTHIADLVYQAIIAAT